MREKNSLCNNIYLELTTYLNKKNELTKLLDRKPEIEELSNETGLSIERIQELERIEIDKTEDTEIELLFRLFVKNNTLAKMRKERGLKQEDISNLIGIGSQCYGRIENLLDFPKQEIQEKLAKLFNTTTIKLFPEWVKIFSEKWKRTEKSKILKIKYNQISDNKEVLQLTNGNDDIVNLAQNSILKNIWTEDIKDILTPREAKLLSLRYGLEDNISRDLGELATLFDVSRERIRQIEQKAFEKIRTNKPYLKKYLS